MKACTLAAGVILVFSSPLALSFSADELHSEIWSEVEAVSKSCIRTDQRSINDALRISVLEHSEQSVRVAYENAKKQSAINADKELRAPL